MQMDANLMEKDLLGTEFRDFADFEKWLKMYEVMAYCKFYKADSRSVERANRCITDGHPKFPEEYKYAYIKYRCKHAGVYKSKSSGIRKKTKTYRLDCPVNIFLKADRLKLRLYIFSCDLQHNHPVSQTIFNMYSLPKIKKYQIPGVLESVSMPLIHGEENEEMENASSNHFSTKRKRGQTKNKFNKQKSKFAIKGDYMFDEIGSGNSESANNEDEDPNRLRVIIEGDYPLKSWNKKIDFEPDDEDDTTLFCLNLIPKLTSLPPMERNEVKQRIVELVNSKTPDYQVEIAMSEET